MYIVIVAQAQKEAELKDSQYVVTKRLITQGA